MSEREAALKDPAPVHQRTAVIRRREPVQRTRSVEDRLQADLAEWLRQRRVPRT